jgi:ssDNA-binding Zn-finger/Zn-ribbon topoisomerase 1
MSEAPKWWESTDLLNGSQGVIVSPQGQPLVMIPCPKCGRRPVVYNGNYFCDGYPDLETRKGTCNWAMSHPVRKKREREICDLLGIDYG